MYECERIHPNISIKNYHYKVLIALNDVAHIQFKFIKFTTVQIPQGTLCIV